MVVDEAVSAAADGLEEELEGWSKLGRDLASVRDEDAHKERLVHLALELRARCFICAIEVGDEGEGRFKVLFDDVEAEFKGGEPLFDVVEFSADAFLFDLE